MRAVLACRSALLPFVASTNAAAARHRNPHGDDAMRFLSMVRINERAGQRPSAQLMEDMGKLMAELSTAGSLLDTAGLQPTAEGKRVRLSRGRQTVVDGPFTETKEVVAGYAMLQAASMEEALEITRRFLAVHGDQWEIECEVRQVMEHCAEAA
jgi:hypothetical protein